MSCYTDYKAVLNNTFIDSKSLEVLGSQDLSSDIDNHICRLKSLSDQERDLVETTLYILSEISFYKMALETKIHVNKIPSVKDPERLYIQLRGAVPYAKGKRAWVSQYVGRLEEVCDDDGNILQNKFCENREILIKKLVDRLRDTLG